MEKQRYKELGDFLKTRRAKISPSQVGLSEGLRRRTPGLRREEVAHIAGVGLTWYTWLEQGRAIQVSADVLESLSRVLMLDEQERIHLYTLARQALSTDIPSYQETVSPMLQHVLDNLILSPSFIMDTRWNIIAWNKAASLVFADFSKIDVNKRNMVWMMFTYDDYKKLFIDWEFHAQGMLARFRSTFGQYIEDPWLVKFIEDLKRESEEFNLWWSNHDVQRNSEIYKKLKHPIVGELLFEFSSFDVSDNSSLKLIVNTPFSETDTDAKIKLLFFMNKDNLTKNQIVDDARDVIEYLCKTYGKDKIILVGHSWGTELGINIIKKDSSRISSYIGVGQVVNQAEGEPISYEFAKDLAKQNQDSIALKDLDDVGSPPYKDVVKGTLEKENIIKKYSPLGEDINVTKDIIKGSLFSPESNGLDAIKYACGNKLSAETLWGTNKDFNLFKDVKKVDIPIYFCAGRYDYTTPSALVEKYYETLEAPYKEFIWFENSAHFPQYTESDKFSDLLLNISNKNMKNK